MKLDDMMPKDPWKETVSINGIPTPLDMAVFLMLAELVKKVDLLTKAIEMQTNEGPADDPPPIR
jgi:hypothetical protein